MCREFVQLSMLDYERAYLPTMNHGYHGIPWCFPNSPGFLTSFFSLVPGLSHASPADSAQATAPMTGPTCCVWRPGTARTFWRPWKPFGKAANAKVDGLVPGGGREGLGVMKIHSGGQFFPCKNWEDSPPKWEE